MARHGFGSGEYKYFDAPLPEVGGPRCGRAFYAAAGRDGQPLGRGGAGEDVRVTRASSRLFLERCHEAGQLRRLPCSSATGTGDWNALHQDVYGEVAFPLQIVALLDRPGVDFEGGEFVLAGAAAAGPEPGPCPAAPAGRLPDLRHPPPAGRGEARLLPGGGAPRREHADAGGGRTTLGVIFHDAR